MENKTWKKIKNWLLYGLFWTMAPILAVVIPKIIVGYSIDVSQIIPDYILVVFAVSTNLMSCRVEFPTPVSQKPIRILVEVAGVIAFSAMFLLTVVYLSFYNAFKSEEIIATFLSSGTRFTVFCIVSSIFLLLDAVLVLRQVSK